MSTLFNIVSLVVHLAPERAEAAEAAIAAMPGVEIVARGDGHRLAVTVVDTAEALAIDATTAMHRLPGVVSVSLAYHAMDDGPHNSDPVSTCACGGGGACHDTHSTSSILSDQRA